MFKIYSKESCGQCKQAKLLLDMKGIEYGYLLLNKDYSVEDIKQVSPTAKSFPLITVDGEFLGGLQELKEKLK